MEIQTRERAAGLSFPALQQIGLIRRTQSYTWAEMLENAAQLAGGRRPERVTVASWRDGTSARVSELLRCPSGHPTGEQTSRLARRVANDLSAAGWRLERVLSDNGGEFRNRDSGRPWSGSARATR